MSLSATIFDTHAEVTIKGSTLLDFNNQLDDFRDLFAKEDRVYDPNRKVWVISRYEKYLHLPFMKMALENRRKQLELF